MKKWSNGNRDTTGDATVAEQPRGEHYHGLHTSLPKSDGYAMIMVVVDSFSKYATFMPTIVDCTSKEAA